MESRFHRMLQVVAAAAFVFSASVSHAIPKAAEDENGTVSIAPDIPKPRASARTIKPAVAKPAPSAKTSAKASKSAKKPSARSRGKTKAKKIIRRKK